MKLFTPVEIPSAPFPLEPGASVVSIGSCFATNISSRLERNKFTVTANPFGTLYNPISIANNIIHTLSEQEYQATDLYDYNNTFYPLTHSTRFSSSDRDTCLNEVNSVDSELLSKLKEADLLIITLGTAFVYSLCETGQVVGNCHKLPGTLFERRQLSSEEIISSLSAMIEKVNRVVPHCDIIFTVSPVRYVRDSLIENSRSKAALIYSLGQLTSSNKQIHYFPSYELLMDELRDYRFYDAGLVQPSETAQEIIFERFAKSFLNHEAQSFMKDYRSIRKALDHVVNKDSDNENFIERSIKKIGDLQVTYPQLSFSEEVSYFESLRQL